jgi:hypothetical protein
LNSFQTLFGKFLFIYLKGKASGGHRVDAHHIDLLAHKLIKRTASDLLIQLLGQDILGKAVEAQLSEKQVR